MNIGKIPYLGWAHTRRQRGTRRHCLAECSISALLQMQ